MEMLAALGLGAKGLFDYNRDNFKFDQDQRLEREALRLEMQVERFKLFREDVRDLVELTVGRMDIYHLVGALFLEFCIVLFCEGRVHASAPPFLLSLYLLSNACAFIYLLLAVWLSMHASVASHSFGVRLLTRFVRLPIPSQKQINQLRNTLKDYEHQGLSNLLKLPFVDKKQQWKPMEHPHLLPQGQDPQQPQLEPSQAQLQRGASFPGTGTGTPGTPTNSNEGQLPASRSFTDLLRNRTPTGSRSPIRSFGGAGAGGLTRSVSEISEGEPAVSFAAGAVTSASAASPALPPAPPSTPAAAGRPGEQAPRSPSAAGRPQLGKKDTPLLPEDDEAPIGGEDLLSSTTGALPERHVQLFRQLQAKWQCYDAYCRVCMGLGVNQILQGLSYYAICHTLVENHTPTTGFGLVVMFQATAVALAVLDLAGLSTREIFAVQAIGTMPTFVAALSVTYAEREKHSGALDPEQRYAFAPVAFLCQALWLELWLRVARPSTSDQHTELPRRFRQVLFLDVFNDAGGCDPLEDLNPSRKAKLAALQGKAEAEAQESLDGVVQAAADAASHLNLVQSAIRRWKAAPDWALSSGQRQELDALCHRLSTSGGAIQRELDLLPGKPRALESPLQRWDQLTAANRQTEAFAGSLLGPFVHDAGHQASSFHYDVEGQRCLFDGSAESAKRQGFVLSLGAVSNLAADLERAESKLLEARILRDRRVEERRRTGEAENKKLMKLPSFLFPSERAQAPAPVSRPVGPVEGAFPNLIPLIRERRNSPLFLTVSPQEEDDESGSEAGGAEAAASAGPGANAPRPPADSQAPYGGVAPETFNSGATEPVSFFYPDGAGIELQQVTPNGAASSASGAAPPQQAPSTPGAQRWGRKKGKDPTLVAMAGKHAVHFVPERLPWHVLSRMTRVLQICWFVAGTMILLNVLDLYQADFQHPEHKHSVTGQVVFQPVDVKWPHGRLFNPQGLFCGFGSPGELLVASPFALYASKMLSDTSASLVSDAGSLPGLPAAAALLCGAGRGEAEGQGPAGGGNASSGCLAAGPAAEEGPGLLRLWRFGAAPEGPNTTLLRVEGAPWQLLTGAVMECSAVSGLLRSAAAPGQLCLMLVGWTGAMLPIAVRPLDGLGMPSGEAVLKPILDIPLDLKQGAAGLTALHLEPHSGRLWVLSADGRLESWDLIGFQSLGRWKPSWSAFPKDFRLAALCSDEARGLLVVGRSKSAGPALLRAANPVGPADFRLPPAPGGLLAEIV